MAAVNKTEEHEELDWKQDSLVNQHLHQRHHQLPANTVSSIIELYQHNHTLGLFASV